MPRATDKPPGEPTVSVVVPAYNAAPFIERAIRSALEQTHRVAEVIVVDDASTDQTVEVVSAIAGRDNRVKLVRLDENGGPAKARNAGFDAATSEWIAVLDADDAYLPNRLAHLLSKSEEADILADNLLHYDPATERSSSLRGPAKYHWEEVDLLAFADARRDHEDFGLFQPLFRRAFLAQHRLRYPENVRHGEDFLMAFEALARGARYWLSWRPGYLYTTRNSGWSRTPVDYRAMAAHVQALSRRSDLNLSTAVRERLADRVALIEELHVHEQAKNAFREGRWLHAVALGFRHRKVWKAAWQKVQKALFGQPERRFEFRGSADYWEQRYRQGGTSGAGSYNELATFKADFLNDFVGRNAIRSIVEFGSGDGAQLELANYPTYTGIDISRAAIEGTRRRFAHDPSKTFLHSSELPSGLRTDLSLSLDVVYHLVEDAVFDKYMRDLFDAASRFVIIYSSNVDEPGPSPHVRHRRFTDWVERERADFELAERIPNPFPFDPNDPDNSSFADFYVFARRSAS